MTWEAYFTLSVVFFMFIALAREVAPTDVIVWFALGAIMVVGTATGTKLLPSPGAAIAGMGNSGLVTVGLLFVVVEGLARTGATSRFAEPLMRLKNTPLGITVPMLIAVAAVSALLNNTTVVAMFLPIVHDITKRTGIPPSRLYLPMCFAATMGGVCTLMGTSTNLVIDGLQRRAGLPTIGVFELAWVGIPISVVGILYMVWAGKYLLPDRRPPISLSDDPREYSVELHVNAGGPLVGLSIEDAGLRHLPGLYLAEIQREDQIIAAVSHDVRLRGDDRLVFVGVLDSVVDLRKVRGLDLAPDNRFKFHDRQGRCLIEAVVSPQCPLIGQTIRESGFRSVYEAAVIAVARSGERLRGKIGDVILQPGDTLLLEADMDFPRRHRHNRHFFLVSGVENSEIPRQRKGKIALVILLALLGAVATEQIDLLVGSMVAVGALLITGCCTAGQAREAVDWSVLLVIGAALGIAEALELSGGAAVASVGLVELAGNSPWAVLGAIYLASLLATELITNNAAAALMFPIAMTVAKSLSLSTVPFAVAVMVSASCGFATPFGYQTNMMVVGPGGYRFVDFLKFGIPLDILIMIVAVALIPVIWPF